MEAEGGKGERETEEEADSVDGAVEEIDEGQSTRTWREADWRGGVRDDL
jgi:hypothetical protein